MVIPTKSFPVIGSTSEQEPSEKQAHPEPQVKAVSRTRRTFTKAYKLKMLAAYDACSNQSERGALLRREGLYYARIADWRKLRKT